MRICEARKISLMRDEHGPLCLGHYEADSDEVITVVTRDGAERQGHGKKMLRHLIAHSRS
jgi:hypothetical protein